MSFRADLHRVQVSRYETGLHLPKTLAVVRLAASLGATTDEILPGIDWMPGTISEGRLVVRERKA